VPEPSLLEPFILRLERLGVPYFVTGSMAGIIYGEPRMTHDVDLVVALAMRDIQAFVEAFPIEEFYCPPEDVIAIEVRRGQRGHCNLIHHDTGFKADIYLAFDELHRWALAHRRIVAIDGLRVPIAPVEYVILRKLEYFREGQSPKHVRDIHGILAVSSDQLDRSFLDQWVTLLGLIVEWQGILADADGGGSSGAAPRGQ
jgi:hypothetical protein